MNEETKNPKSAEDSEAVKVDTSVSCCGDCGGKINYKKYINAEEEYICFQCWNENQNEDMECGDDYCPNCKEEYDSIDHEYQICHICGHSNN